MSTSNSDDTADEPSDKTVITGGVKSLDDFVALRRLLDAGKTDEALFSFQLSPERLNTELKTWEKRLRADPELAAEFKKKMRGE